MVTSNKIPDKKIGKMAEQNSSVVVPQRTLLGEVNEHITCPLCRGYYIDATTIVECLHSFCRSCIIKHLQVKSYCPVCEMMINSAKPNIKLDKALQDIVYKLVPGLFQKEMERRQQFYASRPGPAASATPEQRGEDTERIIFSPEDVISFSLEYADHTDADSISSKSSDSNEPQPTSATSRRYLQCPAVVNINHLKKFLSMKFDIDSTQFAIDILYKRVSLPDYYTLMDIAYIYNWKRNEPMRFFYQIIDYVAIRSRLFDINRKGSHFRDRKPSPAPTEDTNVSSPATQLNDQGSEASSGTDSPMPDDTGSKQISDTSIKNQKLEQLSKLVSTKDNPTNTKKLCPSPAKKNDDEVEKSEFLNSFELKAKNNSSTSKSSPLKTNVIDNVGTNQNTSPKAEDTLKRKQQSSNSMPEMKKLKIELEKAKLPEFANNISTLNTPTSSQSGKGLESLTKAKEGDHTMKSPMTPVTVNKVPLASPASVKETKQQLPSVKQSTPESPGVKRPIPVAHNISPKRKPVNETSSSMQAPPTAQKLVSPIKIQIPKLDSQPTTSRTADSNIQKPMVKKMPDLKPSVPPSQMSHNKGQTVNKVRMDLLANNSDPTMDRSKILSQVKAPLGFPNTGLTSGNPLKSLFDTCKINIPSSLSITLTDQKQDPRALGEPANVDPKKSMVNKNLAGSSNNNTHKVPSPPVHNYIEILKLPDTDPKKLIKPDGNSDNKIDTLTQSKASTKTSESSAKGPVPNLKPIADTKLGKTSGSAPITFQQTFEQQLQSLQSDKKPKISKNKSQVPKLVPATPKAFSIVNKLNNPNNKPNQSGTVINPENKLSTALDLSTPHNMQSQLSPHQTKAFETMQSIANLAKKQSLTSKGAQQTVSPSFSGISNRPLTTNVPPIRVPTSNVSQMKVEKSIASGMGPSNLRQEIANKSGQIKPSTNASPTMSSPSYHMTPQSNPGTTQPSPRSARSPSSSPKLVIAEEKQTSNTPEQNLNQSNQITSTQLSNINAPKSESPKALPGPSKPGLKPMKPLTSSGKMPVVRPPMTPTVKPNPSPTDIQLLSAHQALLRHQMEVNAWIKAQTQFNLYKNMSNLAHQAQNDFSKEKQ